MRVLGIDPGISVVGWGVVDAEKGQLNIVASGRVSLDVNISFLERLKCITRKIESLIREYSPQAMSVETPFLARNPKTFAKIARVVGALEITAMNNGLEVAGYSVSEIKQAVVGYGRADKSQVREMVKVLLKLEVSPGSFDAADALACAICHQHTSRQ